MVVLVRDGIEVAGWPLAGRRPPDLEVVDELARLQLAARRLGCSIRLRHACLELLGLLELVGLAEVLAGAGLGLETGVGLGLETGRQAEDGEQVGVEEMVEPDDPVA
jgi:hypothetical protein